MPYETQIARETVIIAAVAHPAAVAAASRPARKHFSFQKLYVYVRVLRAPRRVVTTCLRTNSHGIGIFAQKFVAASVYLKPRNFVEFRSTVSNFHRYVFDIYPRGIRSF